MRKINIAIILIIVLSIVISSYAYTIIPGDRVISHWDINGHANGYMPKFWGLFIVPIMSIVLYLLFILIPKIDPLKENIRKFQNSYYLFIFIMMLFLLYMLILIVIANKGYEFDFTKAIIPAIGLLFFYIGTLLGKVKRNWFIGIRTPWTLSSDEVWNKTHRLGALLFKISGVIILFGIFFQNYLMYFILVPVIVSSVWLILYSYIEFRRTKNLKSTKND